MRVCIAVVHFGVGYAFVPGCIIWAVCGFICAWMLRVALHNDLIFASEAVYQRDICILVWFLCIVWHGLGCTGDARMGYLW